MKKTRVLERVLEPYVPLIEARGEDIQIISANPSENC